MAATGLEGLGESIKTSTDLLLFVMKRAQALFRDLEEVLSETGDWVPTGNTMFFSSYSTTLDTLHERMPAGVGKLYAQSSDDETTREAAVVETHFSPSSGAGEALMVLGHVQFTRKVSYAEASNQYDAGSFVETLYGKETPFFGQTRRFEAGEHPGVFESAGVVRIISWPLVQITSPEWLRKTVLGTLQKWTSTSETARRPTRRTRTQP